MLKLTNPRLRRFNVVVNSFDGCVSNATKEFSRTPEVSMSKMSSKPGMFFEKFKGTVAFKKLKGFANTHRRGKLNKQVYVVSSDVQLINLAFPSISNLPDEKLTIHFQPIELKGTHCIFNFPHEVEGILSEAMLPRFQIHFQSSETLIRNKVLTMLGFNFKEPSISAPHTNISKELNLLEDGDSSPNLKVRVSSPLM